MFDQAGAPHFCGGGAMSGVDTGGPAFPYHGPDAKNAGMTLRDYFAGLAIGPLMAQPFFIMQSCQKGAGEYAPDFADEAYEIADAMLKARQA